VPDRNQKRLQSLYIATVASVGLCVVAESIIQFSSAVPGIEWFLLAALTLVTGSFTVKLPGLSSKISISETFVFSTVLLFGPAGGTLTVVLDTLVISLWMKRGKQSIARVLFNTSAAAIALRLASEVFFRISHAVPGEITRNDIGPLTIPIFALTLLCFVVNTALVAGALGFERRESPLKIWWAHFPQVSITYFVGGSVAMLLVAYTEKIDGAVVGIILPLLVIWHLTFKRSMGRLEDAHRHVQQVNDLYLSTIEALAMAVDAKDQVTHGHIRRVQVYAVELAKRLGVRETNQLKAIEAAALLHDMGKLAIPEYILNKPGKLTAAEFSKMKQHADIGADLLSSVRFPYPVVPIVRHHHENWNGSGYPSGLSQTDIPLGARILSVVDCFDALTSDRPYRPKLSDEAAFAILQERRGNMYDPLVVDAFIAVHPEIATAAQLAGEHARSLTSSSQVVEPLSLTEGIRITADQTRLLAELHGVIRDVTHPEVILGLTFERLKRLLPADVCALFSYSPERDSLTCVAAAGTNSGRVAGLTIPNGERVTGWAVANETTIANSQAALDLHAAAELFSPRLRSTITTPLRCQTKPLGALTIYSTADDPFTDEHMYVLERIAALVSERMNAAGDGSSLSRRVS
jgi:putative nucleotidyltransferase with HDIG domain